MTIVLGLRRGGDRRARTRSGGRTRRGTRRFRCWPSTWAAARAPRAERFCSRSSPPSPSPRSSPSSPGSPSPPRPPSPTTCTPRCGAGAPSRAARWPWPGSPRSGSAWSRSRSACSPATSTWPSWWASPSRSPPPRICRCCSTRCSGAASPRGARSGRCTAGWSRPCCWCVLSPVVSGSPESLFPGVDFQYFPLQNPGLVSIPLGFLAGWLGTVTSAEAAGRGQARGDRGAVADGGGGRVSGAAAVTVVRPGSASSGRRGPQARAAQA